MSFGDADRFVAEIRENPGQVLLQGGVNFAKQHYVLSGTWFLGLLFALFGAGFQVSRETNNEYISAMYGVSDVYDNEFLPKHHEVGHAYSVYYQSKGWFWRCDNVCHSNYQVYELRLAELAIVQAKIDSQKSVANKIVGPLSTISVNEAWNMFWGAWERGKASAKRMTYYDLMFTAFSVGTRSSRRGEDSAFVRFLIQMAIRVLVNFTLGLVIALCSFVYSAFWFALTFGMHLSTLVFFVACVSVSFFIISTAIGLIYTGTGTVVYFAANAAARRRLAGGRQRQYRGVRYHTD